MPERLSVRAAALIPMIIVLPANHMDIDGACFELTNAVLVFENEEDRGDEQLTVLHEISHILDPGWEHVALSAVAYEEISKAPVFTQQSARRSGITALEVFAELASWEMAEVQELRHLPKSTAIVHEALIWEG